MRYLIAHAPHAPGRKASNERLVTDLEIGNGVSPYDLDVIESPGPEHAAIWARRVWEFADGFADHVCILNDDVTLAPNFVDRLERAVAAVPDECLSLHASNPNVAAVTGAWARCYHYSGPAVVLPPGAARALLDYVYTLPWSLLSRANEDNIANEWAWSRQRPFWYLLPSPVTHDTSVPSTLGYDAHPYRVPVVGPDEPERDVTVTDRDAVPFVQLDWAHTSALAYRREVVRGGGTFCVFCGAVEGVCGNAAAKSCIPCIAKLNAAALAGRA